MKERRAIVLLIAFVILALFSVSLGYISDQNRKPGAAGRAAGSEASATAETEASDPESSAPGGPADAVTAATPNGGAPGSSTDAVTSATADTSSSGSYTPGTDATTGATPAPSPSPAPPDTVTGPTPAPSTEPAPPPDTTTGPTPAPAPGTDPTEPSEPEEEDEDEREDDSTVTIGWLPGGGDAISGFSVSSALPAVLLRSRFSPFSIALFRILFEMQLRDGEKLAGR